MEMTNFSDIHLDALRSAQANCLHKRNSRRRASRQGRASARWRARRPGGAGLDGEHGVEQ